MFENGQIKEVEIIDINHTGQGVAKVDNFVVFVDNAVTGDIVEIEITEKKKNFAVGNLKRIIKESPKRIKPQCSYYYDCGGCQLMHLDYAANLLYKKNRVINELRRASVNMEDVKVHETMGMEEPFRYRNKTAFSVAEKNKEIIIGPYEQGTYNTVNISGCLLQTTEADRAVELFKNLMIKHNIKAYDKRTGNGSVKNVVVRSSRKNELMFIVVTSSENFPAKEKLVQELTTAIKEIKTVVQNINPKNTNLVMGHKNITLYGKGTITDTIGNLTFTISPETFFQINAQQTEKLYEKAIEYADLKKDQVCFDIYCGIGTISLMAARNAKKVYGVEIVEQSIINAKENAAANNINNAEFFAGKAEVVLPKLYKKNIKADVVIVDPPRKGCEKEVIDTIVSMKSNRVVYVSCNPSTLARDIKLLEDGGYRLLEVQPVDQFPWTHHVESIILMTYCGSDGKE
ncbi:MAG: 23S rRNA (uracil(1939)-C(5))-methyltransferase RlmD [Sedimentibacter saalensis]|uniref:23S rRNA (uracil(1939)-C(5))-methyltransferase RlmD n=1 Tax=Sedimentibacter saalensis TaxID=130788 RepID=UPI002B1FB340|nr:23S rRNA (uracil(1939)-C(5))-methyltransferase RlmD [Sedimentibacter saalensis]MEA5093786.1 23S rRNA (uracil(1939)-C(5))-methyltransferase RlmD [Sedimentibacter saalensis]